MSVRLALKTLILMPIVFTVALVMYLLIGLAGVVSFFIGTLLMPTAVYKFLVMKEEFKRIIK